MITVYSGQTNTLTYYSRYNRIDKFEILDHNSRIVDSGLTSIIGDGGKIQHTGLTYQFILNNLYTYKAYFISGGTYIANQTLLKTDYNRNTEFNVIPETIKPKNTFRVKNKLQIISP